MEWHDGKKSVLQSTDGRVQTNLHWNNFVIADQTILPSNLTVYLTSRNEMGEQRGNDDIQHYDSKFTN